MKLNLNASNSCLRAYKPDLSLKWKNVECGIDNVDDTIALTSVAIQNKFHRNLSDFENHLDDPHSADFYNTELAQRLTMLS